MPRRSPEERKIIKEEVVKLRATVHLPTRIAKELNDTYGFHPAVTVSEVHNHLYPNRTGRPFLRRHNKE